MPSVPTDDSVGDPSTLDQWLRASRPPQGVAEQDFGLTQTIAAVTGLQRPEPRVGRYRLQQRIGAGGMGVVFQAHDPELDRPVAIKMLRREAEPGWAERLLREARALARVSHPNVVAIYDVGQTRREVYLAMELVQGQSLRDWLDDTPQPWTSVLGVFLQAAAGLDAIHERGLVHRDFKPENVLIGRDGRVRVADFGLAHAPSPPASIPGPAEGSTAGAQTHRAGTRGYIPPEVLTGGTPTVRGDVFSFCVALWEALSGEHPWPRADAAGDSSEHPIETTLPPSVPTRIGQTLRRGLAADPELRWPSMSALLGGLGIHPTDDRPRTEVLLLQRVEKYWVSGVLADVLRDVPRLCPRLRRRPDLVRGARRSTPTSPVPPTVDNVDAMLDAADGWLLLAGPPGCGKTTLLLELARDLLLPAKLDPRRPIPVVLNLSSWAQRRAPLERWLCDELRDKYRLRPRLAAQMVEQDRLVLLLDGLDEVRPDARDACIEAINAYIRQHPGPAVVATRLDAYPRGSARLQLDDAVAIDLLDDTQIDEYVASLGPRGRELGSMLARDPRLLSMARSPLMLAIMTAGTPMEDVATPDERRRNVFDSYLDAMFERRGNTPPEVRRQTLAQLSWLARSLHRASLSELWIERMQPDWFESRRLRFAFVALVLLTVTLVHVGINVAANVLVDGVELGLATGLSLGLISTPIIFLFTGLRTIRPVEVLRWSWRSTLTSMPRTVGLGVLAGLAFGMVFEPLSGILMGLAGGALVGVVSGLTVVDIGKHPRPNEGIRQSARNAVGVFLLVAAVSGPFYGYVVVPVAQRLLGGDLSLVGIVPGWSVMVGSAVLYGMLLGLIRGGVAVIQHAWLRALARWAGLLPWDLPALLDRACDHAVMRRVGGGYIFLHRSLLEHLASRA